MSQPMCGFWVPSCWIRIWSRMLYVLSRHYSITRLTSAPSVGCGDVKDETSNGGLPAPEQDCNYACSGDPTHLCGAAERLSLYHWIGDLNVWHTPTNIGRYEVCRDAWDCNFAGN